MRPWSTSPINLQRSPLSVAQNPVPLKPSALVTLVTVMYSVTLFLPISFLYTIYMICRGAVELGSIFVVCLGKFDLLCLNLPSYCTMYGQLMGFVCVCVCVCVRERGRERERERDTWQLDHTHRAIILRQNKACHRVTKTTFVDLDISTHTLKIKHYMAKFV